MEDTRSMFTPQKLFRKLVACSAASIMLAGVVVTQPRQAWADAAPAQQPVDAPVDAPRVAADDIEPNQPLKTSFLINVSVKGEAVPSGNYVVTPTGNILLHIDEVPTPVMVRGLTPLQAADTLAKFLKSYIINPQVTVTILGIPEPVVTVSGAVKMSGPIAINRHTTLMELLSKAGWTEMADLSQVQITHYDGIVDQAKPEITTYHLDRYLQPRIGSSPDVTQNPILQDKDSIFVPLHSVLSNGTFTVAGEVTKPMVQMPMRINPPMTVREVISLAGGVTPSANRKSIVINRASDPNPIEIDLDKAELGDVTQNVQLKPDDSIYVGRLSIGALIDMEGGFAKPGQVAFRDKMTLTQAIIDAGGLAASAKLKDGVVIRHPDSDPKSTKLIRFHWNDIVAGKEKDLALQPGDSIWMPPGVPKIPKTLDDYLGPLTYLLGPHI